MGHPVSDPQNRLLRHRPSLLGFPEPGPTLSTSPTRSLLVTPLMSEPKMFNWWIRIRKRAIPLFWAAINAGDRVDSALKDMAIVMKQQNRAEEAMKLSSHCRCGRLDDQIALLRHKLFLIQQGMAFNGKRTKTARSQGKKFQVSVEQEATRLLGNLGWALMQQNNYIEAEEAYRRALLLAPDNNKMCNLGICLMKQGRIGEAKETLRRVKPAVADGPRASALQEHSTIATTFSNSNIASTANNKFQDDNVFGDENTNSNIITNRWAQNSVKPPGGGFSLVNSLNIDAPPFYSSKLPKGGGGVLISESLKRTRSGNVPENNKVRKQLISSSPPEKSWADFLPDNKDFEDAIIAAVLGDSCGGHESRRNTDDDDSGIIIAKRNVDKRLKVFQDITLSFSPRAA
ncbi:hypothetical protein DH2020_040340 [Rehmannia glutinosa]|uniref:Uncharacterized protein n=1 Tax=Rehmannia glutinosa TaxID=99300 RepID=A0ABR0UUR9_REHGL